jgi:Rho termination factor, N-terminal domain
MPKVMIGTRVPKGWVEELKKLTETTGQSQAELLSEAIGSYLGLDIPTVGSRLDSLELQFAELDRQFGLLRRSVGRSPASSQAPIAPQAIAQPIPQATSTAAFTAKEIEQMTTAKMKAIASDYGIKNSSRMSKSQLVSELKRKLLHVFKDRLPNKTSPD